MSRVIYLDNNATTCVAPEVFEAMTPFLTKYYGNPSSMYSFGGLVGKSVAEARSQVASLINARDTEIVFTSCGTESDNMAVIGALDANPDKKHIVTTRVEHPAVLSLAKRLEKRGYLVTFLSVDRQGMIDLDELRESITDQTAIVSIMYANNETGTIFPVEEIGQIVKEKGSIFHCDAVQAVGKIPLDMEKSHIDLLSLSAHKLHGPKGVGALYIRRGTRCRPLIIGGHQEKGRRGGTENVASIVGLGRATVLAAEHIQLENTVVREMRDELRQMIFTKIPDSILNGHPEQRLPNTVNISFPYIEGEAILLMLDEHGICASSGSACTSGSLEPSHVLRAMGIPFTAAHGSVRLSLSVYNKPDEIEITANALVQIVKRLREISPFNAESEFNPTGSA